MKTFQITALASIFLSQGLSASAATAAPTVRDERQMTQLGTQILQEADRAAQALQKRDDAAADKDIDGALVARTK